VYLGMNNRNAIALEMADLARGAVAGNDWCRARLLNWAKRVTPRLTAFASFDAMVEANRTGYVPTLRGTQEHEALGIAYDAVMASMGRNARSWPAKNIV
jgi:hypothetical protein